MANIKNIKLNNFRNFTNFKEQFDDKLNIFFGDNGSGKTNILEAISLISKGRGIRNSNILNLIKKKKENFLIKNKIEISKNIYDIKIYTEKNNEKFKKIITVNEDLSKSSLDFINQSISFLTFVPEMERLFQSSPSYRRNFIDRLIFSSRNYYNTVVNKYKKFLLERIKILQNDDIDINWLNQVELQISKIGLEIYDLRTFQIKTLNNNIEILNKKKTLNFDITLKLKDDFQNTDLTLEKYLSKLYESRFFDKKYGGTRYGPHRSDFIAIINNDYEASQLSTGQQKTVVLMILLAQCNFLINEKDIKPILLLDEIASHLDENNRQILLHLIYGFDIQFFLAGTDKNLFSFVSTNAKFYNITNL